MPMPKPVETRHMPVKPTIGATKAPASGRGAIGTGVASRKALTTTNALTSDQGDAADNAVAQASAEEEIAAPPVIARPIPKPTDPVVTRTMESTASNPLRSGVQR